VDRRLLDDQLARGARHARRPPSSRKPCCARRRPASSSIAPSSGRHRAAGQTIAAVVLDGDTRLTALVDEKNLALLRAGQTALVSADAFPNDRFAALLTYAAPGVDAQRGAVEVKFAVPAPPRFLRADMTVSIEVEVADRANALVVPTGAVRDAQADAPWVSHCATAARSASMSSSVPAPRAESRSSRASSPAPGDRRARHPAGRSVRAAH
jgi:HlyD family secretion protein